MATINKLEDLEVWQEAKALGKMIYVLVEKFPKCEEYNLKKHLKENARGLPANIAEGFYRYFKKERLHFYGIAKGCLGEIKSDLHLSYELGYCGKDNILEDYFNQMTKVEKMLNSFIGSTSRTTQV